MRRFAVLGLFLCACASTTSNTQTTSSAQTTPTETSACASEYRRDADVTVFGVRIEGAGDYVAAAPGPSWRFVCASTGDALVRGEQEGGGRSVGIQRDPPAAGEMPITDYLTHFMDAATARLVDAGFSIDQRMGPRALTPDTVGLALRVSKDGRSGVQFVLMRAIRSPIGLLRYTAIEWGDDPARIEAVFDALLHASTVFAPATPPAP